MFQTGSGFTTQTIVIVCVQWSGFMNRNPRTHQTRLNAIFHSKLYNLWPLSLLLLCLPHWRATTEMCGALPLARTEICGALPLARNQVCNGRHMSRRTIVPTMVAAGKARGKRLTAAVLFNFNMNLFCMSFQCRWLEQLVQNFWKFKISLSFLSRLNLVQEET